MKHRQTNLNIFGAPLLWQVDYNHSQSISQQFTFSSPSQHFLGILLSLLPFKRNLPFTRRPNSCVIVWQQLTYWLVFLASLWWLLIFLSLANENWSLCRYASNATFTTSYTFCGVSLLTMTAISVDRLLALLLGLRYRQTVTLKRTYIMVAAFWVLSSLTGLCCILNYLIALWLGHISISLFLLISITSYTKIFRTLSHHQAEVQHHVQQQLSQPNALNMVKYRKAVYIALWVQFAFVVCYIPYFIIETLISQSNTDSLHLVVFWRLTIGLVQFNSTLNPFLYCW